jgi:hypothetical protein
VSGSAAMRDRPYSLRSHITFIPGSPQMIRHPAPSYQTRTVRLEMFGKHCAQVAF